MTRAKRRALFRWAILPVPLLLTGCTRAPSFDIWGSFFPAWLVCFLVAIVFTALTDITLRYFRLTVALPVLTYASLTALYTFSLWLLFLR